jgi:alginate O-acetyltransferase complex protein AlgI
MAFSTLSFTLVFLPLVICGFWLLRQWEQGPWARVWLIAASAVFFGFHQPSNLILIALSAIFNFCVARRLTVTSGLVARRWLWIGLVANFAFLAAFKYLDFFSATFNQVVGTHLNPPGLPLLLGVSFFTIAQAVLLVDCYQKSDRVDKLLDHLSFVLFFPYLISGPIERFANMGKQLRAEAKLGEASGKIALGLFLFSIGLVKKLVFGDAFSAISDAGYAGISSLSVIEAWISSAAYFLHLYFDFSGYSDMALGCALMLGIEVQQNFRAPLKSTSVSDFWRRWHISLSNVITSYLFTPIVKIFGKVTLLSSAVATILAMLIAGLWHGPSWNYLLFGAIHGVGLAFNQVWRKKFKSFKMPKPMAIVLTLVFLNFSFVVFRSDTLKDAGEMLAIMLGASRSIWDVSVLAVHVKLGLTFFIKPVFLGLLIAAFGKSSYDLAKSFQTNRKTSLVTVVCMLLGLVVMNTSAAKKFVYFGF